MIAVEINQRNELFAKIWWEDLSGPRRFLSTAAEKLSAGKSVVLHLPESVPWVETMRNVLEKLLRRGTQSIKIVDAEKISDEPQKFVLDELCADKSGFRPFNRKAYAKFLATRTGIALNDTCLWIRNADSAKSADWFAFIAEYHGFLKAQRGGIFLLETKNSFVGKSGVEILSYDDKISDYDSFAFNIFTAADFGNENRLMKQYLAELVTAFTAGNVEFGSVCIQHRNEFLRAPANVFDEILREGKFTTKKTPEDIDRDIWTTQLKLIFPLVENFRRRFIKRYEDEIRGRIPFHSAPLEELEIGALFGLFNGKNWHLIANDGADLEFYREIRNKLAHLKILPFDELQKVFDKNSRR